MSNLSTPPMKKLPSSSSPSTSKGGSIGGGNAGDSIILEEEIDPHYEPTEDEVLEYAKWLGMDLIEDADLTWIAREGLKAPLPENWKPCKTTDTEEIYYFNFSSGESTWDHPCDEYYRQVYQEEKNRKIIKKKTRGEDKDQKKKKKEKDEIKKIIGTQTSDKNLNVLAAPSKNSSNASSGSPLGDIKSMSSSKGSAALGSLKPLPGLSFESTPTTSKVRGEEERSRSSSSSNVESSELTEIRSKSKVPLTSKTPLSSSSKSDKKERSKDKKEKHRHDDEDDNERERSGEKEKHNSNNNDERGEKHHRRHSDDYERHHRDESERHHRDESEKHLREDGEKYHSRGESGEKETSSSRKKVSLEDSKDGSDPEFSTQIAKERHKVEFQKLEDEQQEEINRLKAKHRKIMDAMQSEHEQDEISIKKSYKNILLDLRDAEDKKIEDVKKQFREELLSLKKKNEDELSLLRSEMRRERERERNRNDEELAEDKKRHSINISNLNDQNQKEILNLKKRLESEAYEEAVKLSSSNIILIKEKLERENEEKRNEIVRTNERELRVVSEDLYLELRKVKASSSSEVERLSIAMDLQIREEKRKHESDLQKLRDSFRSKEAEERATFFSSLEKKRENWKDEIRSSNKTPLEDNVEIESLLKKCRLLESDLDEAKSSFSRAEEEKRRYITENEKVSDDLKKSLIESNKLSLQLKLTEEELKNLRNNKSHEIDQLSNEIDQLSNERDKLQQQIGQLGKFDQEKNITISKLKQQLDEIEKNSNVSITDSNNSRISQLLSEKDQLIASYQISTLENEKKYKSTIAALEEEKMKFQSNGNDVNKNIKSIVEELKESLNGAKNMILQNENEISALVREKESLSNDLIAKNKLALEYKNESENKLDIFLKKNLELNSEIENLKQLNSEYLLEREKMQKDKENYLKEREGYVSDRLKLDAYEKASKDNQKLILEVKEKQLSQSLAPEENVKGETFINLKSTNPREVKEDHTSIIDALKSDKKRLENEILSSAKELENFKLSSAKELENIRAELRGKEIVIASMKSQIDYLTLQIGSLTKQIDSLRSVNASVNKILSDGKGVGEHDFEDYINRFKASQEDIIKSKDDFIKSKEDFIKTKDEVIKSKDEIIKSKEDEIKSLTSCLNIEREKSLSNISKLNSLSEELAITKSKLNKEMEENNEKLKKLEQNKSVEISQLKNECNNLKGDLERKEKEITKEKEIIKERVSELKEKEEELKMKEVEMNGKGRKDEVIKISLDKPGLNNSLMNISEMDEKENPKNHINNNNNNKGDDSYFRKHDKERGENNEEEGEEEGEEEEEDEGGDKENLFKKQRSIKGGGKKDNRLWIARLEAEKELLLKAQNYVSKQKKNLKSRQKALMKDLNSFQSRNSNLKGQTQKEVRRNLNSRTNRLNEEIKSIKETDRWIESRRIKIDSLEEAISKFDFHILEKGDKFEESDAGDSLASLDRLSADLDTDLDSLYLYDGLESAEIFNKNNNNRSHFENLHHSNFDVHPSKENDLKWLFNSRSKRDIVPGLSNLQMTHADILGKMYKLKLSKFDENEKNTAQEMQRHIQWLKDMKSQLANYSTNSGSIRTPLGKKIENRLKVGRMEEDNDFAL